MMGANPVVAHRAKEIQMPQPSITRAARTRQRFGAIAAASALASLVACGGNQSVGPETQFQGQMPDGRVQMRQFQAAYIGSGSAGSGTLQFRGATSPFTVGGLGVGGIGVSEIQAEGEVYNLPNVQAFPGAYAQGRYGFALGRTSGGDLWLKNESGVVMHLHAKREGFMLSLGGDAVVISMK
jgi:hypothetical protein